MAPKFDPNKPYKVLGGLDTSSISSPDEAMGVMGKAAEAIDIPASLARAGVYGAVSDDSSAMGEIGAQIERLKRGSSGVKEGPTGEDILSAVGVEDPTALKYGGMATEMVIDPLQALPIGKAVKPLKRSLNTKSAKSAARVLKDNISVSQYTGEGLDPRVLGEELVQQDLIKYIHNPEKLLEIIEGPRRILKENTLQTGKSAIRSKKNSGGLISEISDDLGIHIDEISSYSPEVKNFRIQEPILTKKLADMASKTSGVAMDATKFRKTQKMIRDIMGKKRDSMSLKDLYRLKKNLGKEISSRDFWKSPDAGVAEKKETMVSLIRQIDDVIRGQLQGKNIEVDGVIEDAGKYYDVQNSRLHHLIQLRGVMNAAELRDLKKLNIPQILTESGMAGSAMGLGTAAMGASPGQAFQTGAMTSAAWGFRQAGQQAADAMMSKGYNRAAKALEPVTRMLPQASRELREEPLSVQTPYAQRVMREPQSVMAAPERIDNLPKQLIKAKLPRTTEGLKENSKLFKLKTAQMAEQLILNKMAKAGMDTSQADPAEIRQAATELYKNVATVLDEHPEEIGAMLPMWIQQYPEMFEKDRYGRIDGVVPTSNQPMVREELRKNKNISNMERIEKLDTLNRTGQYED